ncbi:MAG: PKD domain-containing protein [Bacteroidetes bacterium]|nr:PKD domain-containing protein [Bacteroidota bacterium]
MKKSLLRATTLLATFGIFFITKTNSSGPGATYSGAPSESTCQGCHSSFSLKTSGGVYNKIQLLNNFTGSGYIPDSTYTMYLTHRVANKTGYGFQITCLEANTNLPSGTFGTSDSRTQAMTATVGSQTRSYIGHTSSGVAAVSSDSQAWKFTWKAPSKNVGNVRFYVVVNVTNSDGGTSGDSIYAKTFTFGPSTLLPTATPKITDPDACSGLAINFGATTTGSPTAYEWQFPSTSTSSTPKITYGTAGTYKAILRVKNNKGFSKHDTLTFTVKQGATAPSISPGTSPQSICAGDSLRFSVPNVTSGHTYLWSPGGKTKQTVYMRDSGTYSCTVTNTTTGCKRTSSAIKLVLNERPAIAIDKLYSSDTVCANTSFQLRARRTSGPADSFSFTSASGPWSADSMLTTTLSSGPVAMKAWAKSKKGCAGAPASVIVNVSQSAGGPALSVSNITYTSFRIEWNAVSGATGYKVSVDSGKTFINPSSGSTGLYHDLSGMLGNTAVNVQVYALTNDVCGKSLISNITGTTLSCSPLNFSVTADKNVVCKNGSTMLRIRNVAGKNIGVKIDGSFKGSDTAYSVNVPGYTVFTVSVLDSAALICGYTNKQITISEDTVFAPVINPAGNMLICSKNTNSSQQMLVTSNSTIDSLLYYQNNLMKSRGVAINYTYTVSDGDSLWVIGKNTRGCSVSSSKTYISMPGIPHTPFTYSNVQFNYTFTPDDTLGTHTWKGPDGLNSSSKNPTFNLAGSKNKTVRIYHEITYKGCKGIDSVDIAVPDFNRLNPAAFEAGVLYPNPAAQVLKVTLRKGMNSGVLEVTDVTGKRVMHVSLDSSESELDVRMLAPGAYLYSLKAGNFASSGRLLIKR